MAFTQQELDIIKFGKENGKSRQDIEQAIFNYRNGITPKQAVQEPSAIQRATTTIQTKAQRAKQNITGEGEFAGQSPIRQGTQAVAEITGIVPQVAVDVAPKPIRSAIEKVTGAIGQGFKSLTDKIAGTEVFKGAAGNLVVNKDGSYEFVPTETRAVEETLGTTQAGGQIAGDILMAEGGVKGVQKVSDKVIKVGNETIDNLSKSVLDGKSLVGRGNEVKQTLGQFIAPEVDELTKTILKRTKPSEIDDFVKIQENAIKDPTAITPYEKVGDTMTQATKQLQSQIKALGEQKSTIISKAKNGLEDFSKPTREAILDIQKISKNSPVAQSFISKLKTVKNKLQADKVIDELQDVLYTGNKDLTIPVGSSLDKQLRGILGKYNNTLKNSLPKSYQTINTQISNRIKVVNALNRALGEVVDGVSVRGGSLIKQFFSPSGRKAKELFDYIKTNTGVDLAKDATLARYIMELYGDSRVNTLLGGQIPTSVSGAINKAVDFAVQKTGLGKKVQEAGRQGAIENAKKLGGTLSNTE